MNPIPRARARRRYRRHSIQKKPRLRIVPLNDSMSTSSSRAHHHHDAPYALGRDNRRALEAPIALPGASRALSDASDVDCRRKLSILMRARERHSNRQSIIGACASLSLSLSLSLARAHLARKLCIFATDPGASRATLASRNAIVRTQTASRSEAGERARAVARSPVDLVVYATHAHVCGHGRHGPCDREGHLDTSDRCTVCDTASPRVTGSSWYGRVFGSVWRSGI